MLAVDGEAAISNHGEDPQVEGGEGQVPCVCWVLMVVRKHWQTCLTSSGEEWGQELPATWVEVQLQVVE